MKARIIPTAFLSGIVCVYLSYYYSAEVLFTFPICAAVFCAVFKFVFKRKVRGFFVGALWVILLSLYTLSMADGTDSALEKYSEDICIVYGKVTHVADETEFFNSYRISIDKLTDKSGNNLQNIDEKCFLNVEKSEDKFSYGDYICAAVEVHKIGGPENSGETDFALIHKSDKMYYTLVAKAKNVVRLHGFEKISGIEDVSYVARNYVNEVCEKVLSDESGAILMGILVSENRYLNEQTRTSLENAGLMHLTAASGLHVSCIVTIVTLVLGMVSVRRRIAFCAAMPIIFMYVFISGGSVSIIRAAVMIFAYIIAGCVRREYDSVISLSLAGVIAILINPINIFTASFVLSFSAVAAIFFLSEEILRILDKKHMKKATERKLKSYRLMGVVYYLKTTFAVCLAVQLVIIPINLYFFGYVSSYSIVVNLLISWMLTPIMFISALMLISSFCHPLCAVFAFVLEIFLKCILFITKAVSGLPFSRIEAYMTFAGAVFCILVIALVFNCFKKNKKTSIALGVVCLAIALNNAAGYMNKQRCIQINFVNVGQGDGCFIEYGNGKAIVIDGGNNFTGTDNTFTPYMERSGVKEVECIFVSHFEDDHAKNVLSVMDRFEVKNIVLPMRECKNELMNEILEKAKTENCNIIYVGEGDYLKISKDITAEIYAPNIFTASEPEENVGSMAVKFEIANTKVLFLGDLPLEIQEEISDKYKYELDCDILKISHHGAIDGYSEVLIDYATPEYAVISCGESNAYEHPESWVIKQLAKNKIETFITSENGDINFFIDRKGKYGVRVQTMAR